MDSEWFGLAPHIEEDVASSSISQDSMGHAAMFYKLLEELGEGNADALAHARPAQERKNCILVERVNGPGNYMENPDMIGPMPLFGTIYIQQQKRSKFNLKTKRLSAVSRCSG